jgi:hypothetical protein
MPVSGTLLGEQSQGRGGIRSSGGVPILDETYHYLVKMAAVTADKVDALSVSGVPLVGITQTINGYAICKTVDAVRREDQRLYWDVTAVFSSEVDERQSVQNIKGNPTEWVPIYETKFERLQEVVTKDLAGNRVANSAGQPFETGIIRSRFIPIWEFYQFEPDTVTDEQVIERNEVVNSAEFKGRDEHTLLCTVLSSVVGFYYGSRRRLTRYAIRYNEYTWKHYRLDVGTVYLEGGVHRAYLDDDGNVMLGGLNGTGGKVSPGTEPALRQFTMYNQVDFASFLRI